MSIEKEGRPVLTAPPISAEPVLQGIVVVTSGQMLSAKERFTSEFRRRVETEISHGGGGSRTADHISGFRFGWEAAVAYLRAAGAIK